MAARGAGGPVGFAEVPDFHVEVARRRDPSLGDAPLIVGGDPAKRGKVVARSPELAGRGVVEGMGSAEALDRAPEARWVRTDMRHARELSGVLRAAVREEVEAVEIDGLAGFFMRAPAEAEEARALASRLELRVGERTGLPLRMGVAPVRFAARWAAEDAGRRGVRVIGAEAFEDYLLGQPIERLPGVGPKTAARLAELGARDVPGLRALGLERLDVLLGSHGRSLWQLACGEDPKPLRARRHPETLSRAETLSEPSDDPRMLEAALARLAEALEAAMRREGLRAGRLALRLTGAGERTLTRSGPLEPRASTAGELLAAARQLLARVDLAQRPQHRLALVVKGLEVGEAEDRQLDLF